MRGLNQIDARELKENALRYAKVGGACPSMQGTHDRAANKIWAVARLAVLKSMFDTSHIMQTSWKGFSTATSSRVCWATQGKP